MSSRQSFARHGSEEEGAGHNRKIYKKWVGTLLDTDAVGPRGIEEIVVELYEGEDSQKAVVVMRDTITSDRRCYRYRHIQRPDGRCFA